VTVDELDLISRLGEVDTLCDEAIAGAEMTLRKAIFASEPEKTVVAKHMRRPRRPRRYLIGIAGVAASAIIVVGALAFVGGGRSAPTHAVLGHGPVATHPTTGSGRDARATIRLASYSFNLPSGYRPVHNSCGVSWLSQRPRMSYVGATSFAHSTNGGCVAAFLAAGVVAQRPAASRPVRVGQYQGFVVSGSGSAVVLYVEIPAAGTDHALVLIANGLTADQVIAIAASGLHSSIGAHLSCTSGCG
jgi:hypothetical protein